MSTFLNNWLERRAMSGAKSKTYFTDSRVFAYYNVDDISSPTNILNNISGISKMEINDMEVPLSTTYQFDSVGKHLVKYTLLNPLELPGKMFCFLQNIQEVLIPNSVENIRGNGGDRGVFRESSINIVYIPSSVKYIEGNVFYSCNNLNKVIIDNVDDFAKIHYDNYNLRFSYANPLYYAHSLYINEEEVTEYSFPANTINIPNYVFLGAYNINIHIPDTIIENFGLASFSSCKKMTDDIILSKLTFLPDYSFYETNIKSISLPNIITIGTVDNSRCISDNPSIKRIDIGQYCQSIANRAFFNLQRLEEIICRATVPPVLGGQYSFYYMSNTVKFYVPYSADHSILAVYQSAQYWSQWASKMYELNPDGTIPT